MKHNSGPGATKVSCKDTPGVPTALRKAKEYFGFVPVMPVVRLSSDRGVPSVMGTPTHPGMGSEFESNTVRRKLPTVPLTTLVTVRLSLTATYCLPEQVVG